MIKNNNYLDSLSKSLLNDVRSVMENKGCKKDCGCDKCSCDKEEKGEKKEKEEMKETYNKDAVDKAIASSNRSGRKIGSREGKMIHALLKGRTSKKDEVKEEVDQIDEISQELATAAFHGLQDRARKRFARGIISNKKGVMLAKAKIEGDAKVPATRNEEVDMGQAERGMRTSSKHTGGYHVVDKAGKVVSKHKGQRDAMQSALKDDNYKVKAVNEDLELAEEVDFAKVRKQFDRNEDRNAHSENAVLIAKHAGTEAHHKEAKDILKQHKEIGHLSDDLSKRRSALYKQLEKTDNYKKIFPEHKINEEVELDEAKDKSPIAGTRLISKHKGKDGHHAEVRFSPDWNEYSVHHYENGKHMGEGPVSYHGEGREGREDATDTAEHEVKNYRPKGGKLHQVKEETEIDEAKKMKGEDPCWKNYKMVGTKKGKGGKEVPNCVPEETQAKKKLIGNQRRLDKNENGRLDKQDFKLLRKEEASLEEKLNPSMGAGKYVTDFVKSKDPRFEGKTKKERIKMALGAYYGAKNESVESEQIDEISSELAHSYVDKARPDRGFGDEQKARLSQTKRDNRQRYGNVAREKIFAAKNPDKETSVRVPATRNEEVEHVQEAYGSKKNYKKHHISVDGKYVATTTWARDAKEAERRFIKLHPEHKNARITIVKEK